MKKAVIFSRVSTQVQDIEQQTSSMLLEAKHLGYEDFVIIEQKESAIKLDEEERVGIKMLKDAIENEDIGCVIVYEISRLSRRPKVLYSIRDWLLERNIDLVCLKPFMRVIENGKLSDAANIMFSLFAAMSESEMMIKKERLIRGKVAKREKNGYIGGKLLFGYKVENDKIVKDNDKAPIVEEIFKRYADGESIRAIAIDLVERARFNAANIVAARMAIGLMLRREEYCGIRKGGYSYEKIIEKELYDKVQLRNRKTGHYKTDLKYVYYCKGLIYDHSGRRMSPGRAALVYRYDDELSKDGYGININVMDSLVWFVVKRYMLSPKAIDMSKTVREAKKKLYDLHDKIINGRKKIKEAQKMIDKTNERIIRGKISEKQGDKLIDEAKRELEETRRRMLRWDSECVVYERQIGERQDMRKFKDILESMNDEQIREAISGEIGAIIIRRMVTKKEIRFRFIDGHEEVYYEKKRGRFSVIEDENGNEIDYDIKLRFIREGCKKAAVSKLLVDK